MIDIFHKTSFKASQIITNAYSTSFAIGIRLIHTSIRDAIYSIYGFVRYADEIVDTFHEYDQSDLLDEFERDYYKAYKQGISLNPVLHAFQLTVKKYNINDELIQAFLHSMRQDLHKNKYQYIEELNEYIYGSADVVGLMCLKIFVEGDTKEYERLKPYAMKLGSAFQKVNFLRDINNDVEELGRNYFPQIADEDLTDETKKQIIKDINNDFAMALKGIKELPLTCRLGVYTAFLYYKRLTRKIEFTQACQLMKKRIRVSNFVKVFLLMQAFTLCKLGKE